MKPAHHAPKAFRSGNRFVLVRDDDVRWIEAQGRSTRIHTRTETIRVNLGVTATVAALRSNDVVRIHRSAAVNVRRVFEMEPKAHGDWSLRLDDGTLLRLSRTYRASALRKLT